MPPDDEPEPLDELSRLPRQFQIVSGNMSMPEPPRDSLPAVEHDGRLYALADLLRPLTQKELREIEATAPRSNQAFWDEAVRRWPALTAEIVAGAKPDAPSFD